MMDWSYTRGERIADAVVHTVGLLLAAVGVVLLLVHTATLGGLSDMAVAAIYGTGLIAALTASFLYNHWPVSPLKWVFRRFDHSAIFLLIAGTYTPFLAQLPYGTVSVSLATGIWGAALAGIAFKLGLPGRYDRLTIVFYLAVAWSGVLALPALSEALPELTLLLIVVGGVVYSAGVVFHVWESLKFQNAIWHGFVVAGAGIHYWAVFHCLVVERVA
ncbi:PAQR family membrane homeostasis protein TrhA [Chthonobacter rhizosphaerae]|uniref:PAQR family membrane homeostasis protein TrhA n=1 Tax=Chthonobacter rhizosphaerae TaxID=2735553 RepID=UPI0015EEF485|nr:hemolysin III family protein [Chthonobacter rhizosphaerae]